MEDEILVQSKNRVATVTLNRPDQRNSIGYGMWLDLRRIAVDLTQDPDIRAVVFRGAGDKAFSAGANIKDFELYRNNAEKAQLHSEAVISALDAIESIPKPTISMIRGYCVGGGCELSTATDIRMAARGSKFGIPVAKLGILITYEEMRRLVDLVGRGNAMYLLLTGRLIEDEEALRIGLITRLLDENDLESETYALAEEMADLAPLSHAGNKQILRTVLSDPGLDSFDYDEYLCPLANFDSADFQEGRRAFIEIRKPDFKGD